MSLRAAALAHKSRGPSCRVPSIAPLLPADEREEFAEIVRTPGEDLTAIARTIVNDRGITTIYASVDAMKQALNRHRRGDCTCP